MARAKNLSLTLGLLVQVIIALPGRCITNDNRFLCDIRVLPISPVIYEPLRIDIKVQYEGNTPIKAILPTGSSSLVSIELINRDQKQQRKLYAYQLYTDTSAHEVPFPTRVISPGASVIFSLDCIYDWHKNEFLLNSPGVYEVVIRCFIPIEEYGEVKIKEVNAKMNIIVRNYQGNDLDLWKHISIQAILLRQDLNDEQLRKLITLITQYPRSPYRPYALATLGGAFGKISQKITLQQQIVYLEQVISEYVQFPYIDYVVTNLCKLYSDTKQFHKFEMISNLIHFTLENPWTPYRLKMILNNFWKKLNNKTE